MDWLGAAIDGPLIVIRAIHFAATAITAGTLIFRSGGGGARFRSTAEAATRWSGRKSLDRMDRSRHRGGNRSDLASIAGSLDEWSPFGEAMTSEVLSTVVNETQFGLVSKIRFVLAIILAACLAYDRLALSRWSALASALGLIAAIAWTGHAGQLRAKRDTCI